MLHAHRQQSLDFTQKPLGINRFFENPQLARINAFGVL
jgi:hypothetical protein